MVDDSMGSCLLIIVVFRIFNFNLMEKGITVICAFDIHIVDSATWTQTYVKPK